MAEWIDKLIEEGEGVVWYKVIQGNWVKPLRPLPREGYYIGMSCGKEIAFHETDVVPNRIVGDCDTCGRLITTDTRYQNRGMIVCDSKTCRALANHGAFDIVRIPTHTEED